MRCPSCGYMNLRGQVRCKKCGVKMEKKCFNCKAVNSPDARYCKDCGRPIKGKFAKTGKSFLCDNCRSPVEYGSATCPACGAKMSWEEVILEDDL